MELRPYFWKGIQIVWDPVSAGLWTEDPGNFLDL